MKMTYTQHVLGLLFPVLILAASCQKEPAIDLENPPPLPDGIKDSTQLIKSIKLTLSDPSRGNETITEKYFYDTVNHKIIITVDEQVSTVYPSFPVGWEHSYNTSGQLIHILYKYLSGHTPGPDDIAAIGLEYDAEKILKKLTRHYFNGDVKTTPITKTLLAGNQYRLNWQEPVAGRDDTAYVSSVFDEDGRRLKNESSYTYYQIIGNGPTGYTQVIETDTLFYDGNKNVTRVIHSYHDTLNHETETYTACEFKSRNSRGSELYDMRRVLLNGVANIPFGENFLRGTLSGILSFYLSGYEPLEYEKYPFQSATVYLPWTNQYHDFTGSTEFDAKDRLIKFNGFLRGSELIPCNYQITYFK